jgi:hypothetical protein
MAKHRRYSDKPKDRPRTPPPVDVPANLYTEPTQDLSATSPKTNKDFKSILLSGTKYAYIITAVALFSGIFTPLTLGVETEEVISGMLVIFLGLGGGIMIFLGIKNQKYTTIMICGGLVMIIISLILIFELAKHSLFG